MKVVVYGVGAVGARVARQLQSLRSLTDLILVDANLPVAQRAAESLAAPATAATIAALRSETRVERFEAHCEHADLVVLTAADDHIDMATAAVRMGAHVVSASDDLATVRGLLASNDDARERKRCVVVGAGFSPGLTCLLTRHAGQWLDDIEEIRVAKFGTGGPLCARQHHKALRTDGRDWWDAQWQQRQGGSGRELCWFPDPVGGLDCYHGALADPLLLRAAFPRAGRITSRVAATRRDMSTKWLPMLRPPHPEGLVGAVRVELRGRVDGAHKVMVLGALDRPAVAAGTVAATIGSWAVDGRLSRFGAGGLAEFVTDTEPFLAALAERGVRAAIFEGDDPPSQVT